MAVAGRGSSNTPRLVGAGPKNISTPSLHICIHLYSFFTYQYRSVPKFYKFACCLLTRSVDTDRVGEQEKVGRAEKSCISSTWK